MVVVSDTSPIINLATIEHLHLLPELFSEIVIPTAVFNEVASMLFGKDFPEVLIAS